METITKSQSVDPSVDDLDEYRMSFFTKYQIKSLAAFAVIIILFSFFMFLPILTITISAFNFSEPENLFKHFLFVLKDPFFRQSLLNAVFAGLMTTFISSLIGITVTIIFSRYKFFGKKFFGIIVILPLISPPFVGAFALSRILAGNGILSNFLRIFIPGLPQLLGNNIWGVILIQSIHLWPLVYFNTAASYSKIDPAQEEQARNLGSRSLNLYRRIIIPLLTPGLVAGAVLVFIFALGDIGTPIVLSFQAYAPFQAFKDIKEPREVYIEASYALVILLLIISLIALLFAAKVVGMREYAHEKVSGMDQLRMMQRASKRKSLLIWVILGSLMIISLLPHFGIILIAFVERIKYGEIVPTLWNFAGVPTILSDPDVIDMIFNTIFYSLLAMIITIIFGIVIAYIVVRKKHLKGISTVMMIIGAFVGLLLGAQISVHFASVAEKNVIIFGSVIIMAFIFYAIGRILNVRCLEVFATMPFAVPGLVIAIGYLQFFVTPTSVWGLLPTDLDVIPILGTITSAIRNFVYPGLSEGLGPRPGNPLGTRFSSFWIILVISYAMRRMPYTVLASVAILRTIHVSLEEIAHNLGATSSLTMKKITLPLMAGGVFAGGVLTFITSFTEVSSTLIIQPRHGPLNPLIPIPGIERSTPLTLGIFTEITRGGQTLPAGVLGLVQLLVAAIGMIIVQRILGERIGTAFGGG